ncbi:MAG: MgtC/SapB family protein [Porphyromonas sp.]|nr:MgtC/SapB family protein [Porphyromonas sp.]
MVSDFSLSALWSYSNPTLWEAVGRLSLSLLLGAAIGFEREAKYHSAGFRTFTLICLGATLAMLISIWTPVSTHLSSTNPGDPGRIAAQVLTGVGFLGAGAIMRTKGSIQGLTTAAGIWVSAVIGLAIGAGLYLPSIVVTAMMIGVLSFMDRLEVSKRIRGFNKLIELQFDGDPKSLRELESIFGKHNVKIINFSTEFDLHKNTSAISLSVRIASVKEENDLSAELRQLPNLTGMKIYS